MSHERLRPHYFFDEEKIAHLKQIAPECFEDGKINFETLRQNLGDWAQDEEDPELEHFGLFWPGKRDARKAAAIPPQGALEPVWGQGLKADGSPDSDGVNDSKNIFIEGENLEVLKLLQKSYAGKVKMIYIDPPYNTGNDFVYDDDFTEPLQEYLRRTGQVDEEGKPMTTNKRSDGRFHSKWLSMMYPRMRLARNLLREDGVIFVSIDDNEVHNLRAVMNEIFGEENFVSSISRVMKSTSFKGNYFAPSVDYIVCFAKHAVLLPPFSEEIDETQFTKVETEGDRKGEYYRDDLAFYLSTLDITRGSYGQRYFIDAPDGSKLLPPGKTFPPEKGVAGDGVWRWNYESYLKNKHLLVFKSTKRSPLIDEYGNQARYNIYTKSYLIDRAEKGKLPRNYFDQFQNRGGTETLNELDIPFDFSKPPELIKYLIKITNSNLDGIVLDFFAGSGTTAHSILEGRTTGGTSNYICVQLPEKVEENSKAFNDGYKFISDITIERIRRVSKRLQSENVEGDLGVKVLSLKHSNFKQWKHVDGTSVAHLESQLDAFNTNPLVEEVNKDGLLTEIMLLEGFTLCSSITPLEELRSNTIRKVSSEYCDHSLLVCLDEQIAPETVAALNLKGGDIFICLDSAISNVDKLRLSDKGLIKTI